MSLSAAVGLDTGDVYDDAVGFGVTIGWMY